MTQLPHLLLSSLALMLSFACDVDEVDTADFRNLDQIQAEPSLQQALDFDPDEEVEDVKLWTIEDVNDGTALMAESLGVVEFPGGVTVESFHVGNGTIGTLVGGPTTELDTIEAVIQGVAQAEDPLEFSLQESEWAHSAIGQESASTPALVGGGSPAPVLDSASPLPQAATCGISANGHGTLHGNWGNCTTYSRSPGQTTSWTLTDNVAYGANVTAVSGNVNWLAQAQNCNTCSWYVLYSKAITQGQTYYYWVGDNLDDFNTSSVVTQSTGGSHNHDVGRCHDWNARTQYTSSLAGGCEILAFGTPLYCRTSISYIGVDPSNIFTSSYWDGNGSAFSCT